MSLESLLEKTAAAAMVASSGERIELEALLHALDELAEALADTPARAQELEAPRQALAACLSGDPSGAGDALNAIRGALAALQQSAPAARRVERDADTLELMTAFMEETAEGLSRVDQILIAAERAPVGAQEINALFRVFHSIKGVAGFIDLTQTCKLAHTAETLLDLAREGRLALQDQTLELVLDATGAMRQILANVRTAAEQSVDVADVETVPPLVARLERAIAAVEAAPSQPEVAAEPPHVPAPPQVPAEPSPPATALPEEGKPATLPRLVAAPTLATPTVTPPHGGARPGTAPRAPAGQTTSTERLRETLKVDVERVDAVVEMIGELIIVESMVVHAPELAQAQSLKLRNNLGQLVKISRDLQDLAMRMRMVEVRGVFNKMARLTRDLGHKTGKRVVLSMSGEATELDRSMAERIEDPLMHMIRNAVDHGVEPSNRRAKAGKPEQATLRLSALHEGGNAVIELRDDGAGLNREAILAKATSRGLVREGATLSDADVDALIFEPGFSTKEQVTELSGRGVGMDVVKRAVESMRGRVQVSSVPGEGTTFRIVLPLTLAVIEGLLVTCGRERYIIPSLSIVESLRPAPGAVHALGERSEFLAVRGDLVPLVRLSRLLDVPDALTDPTQALAVAIESSGRRLALLVDDVLSQQQVVTKPLGSGVAYGELFSGAAILSDGHVGLILNVDRVASLSLRRAAGDPCDRILEKSA